PHVTTTLSLHDALPISRTVQEKTKRRQILGQCPENHSLVVGRPRRPQKSRGFRHERRFEKSRERRSTCSAQKQRFETRGRKNSGAGGRRGCCERALADIDTMKSDGHSAGLCSWGVLRWPWQGRSLRRRRR